MEENRIYVQVTGRTIPRKELEIYFQSRKQSGGGDIRSIEQINDEESIITFEEKEVARNVSLRTHSIDGARVAVSTTPFSGDNLNAPTNQDDVVIIRGLSEITTKDALQNYLENTRRSGGGAVEEVKITGNSAWVKFESAEVANRVVQRGNHTLNGATLDVSLEVSDKSGDVEKTIKITGLAAKTTKDPILNYFENKHRSGGGEVESVDFRSDTGVAFVTFADVNVAKRVVQRGKHTLDGATLDVSLEVSDKSGDVEKTIKITGLAAKTTKDSLLNYFENKHRSGGGEVESVDFRSDTGVAFVTFADVNVANRVVQRGKHTLDGATLDVSLEVSDKSKDVEKTIKITGLAAKTTKDSLLNYFENKRRSGGGEVESVDFRSDTGVAFVTFVDVNVANRVLQRGNHTLDGATLDVSLEVSDKSGDVEKTIKITGLAAKTTKDSLLNYFENKRRSGGGEVESVDFRSDTGVAFVTFVDVNVANRVLQRGNHTLDGATLDVSLEVSDKSGDVEKTIKITGLAAKTTKDSLLNYFENKRRSGGGEVESVDFRSDTGVAFVTFVDVNVVSSVLQRDKHTLDEAVLTVILSSSSCALSDKEEMQESRVIEVTGLASSTTKDSITNFFENTRRSGGGDIENVECHPDKGLAVITFLSVESAQGVLNKQNLTLDDAELKVTLRKVAKKLPIDTMRLLVKGLSEKTTRDGLISYMEVISEFQEVSDVEFGEEGCALVTFEDEYDYETITKKAAKRPLEGNMLAIEKVPVCGCIQVTGLNRENTTEDTVRYYFEHPKNGGGDVSNVELHLKEGWALVYFEDPQVVTTVTAQSHVLNGANLKVKIHNPAIAKPISHSEEHEVEMEQQVPVDPQVMLFICERHQDDLTRLKDKHAVRMSWEEGANNVTLAPQDNTSRDKERFDDTIKVITSFFDAFLTTTIPIAPDAWQDVVQHFKDSSSSLNAKVKIQYLNQQQEIALTGRKEDVEALAEELQVLKTKVEKQVALEASKKTQIVRGVPPKCMKFLCDLDFDKELEDRYENTEVEVDLDKDEVQIRGPPDTIHKTAAAVWEVAAKMKDVSLKVSQNVVGVLRKDECQSFLKKEFMTSNVQATIAFSEDDENSDTVAVIGMNTESAKTASHIVKNLVTEKSLVLDESQVQLEKSEKWRILKEELSEKLILSIAFDRDNNELALAGRKEDISAAERRITRFFEENTIVSEVVEIPQGCRRFLAKYREQDLRQIQDQLNELSTVIKGMAGGHDEDVIVSGTADGVKRGVNMIKELASAVESQKVPVDKPGMRKALGRSKGKKMLGLIENENKCIIEYFNSDKDASLENTMEEEKEESKKTKQCEYSFLTPEGKKISVFKDDICNRNVDVIVNAANTQLQHSTGVAKAIVDAGGKTIQDECDRYIMTEGSILEGQVVVTSAGKMSFKKVIHAVGPFWRKEATREKSMGKTPKEERILRYAVSNALDAASAFTSVALPAISTGAFEFPLDLCANIMVDATLTFCEENPACRLSEIQFTTTNDAVLTAFVKEMNNRVAQDPNLHASSKAKDPPKVTGKEKRKKRGRKTPAPSPAPVSTDGPRLLTTAEGLKLVLIVGDITREEVDAIVNSTSSDLDLSRNASAQALSAAAGPTLQQECKAIGQVQTGGLAVTSGGNLGCKNVFHTSCSGWENGKGEQVLRDIVKKSLNEAQKRNLSSIAIPAIGTGNLQFPHDRVAAASFDEVVSFSKKNPNSIIKEVHFVVYDKDLSSVQAFQTELQNLKGNKPQPPVPADSVNKKRRKLRGAAAKNSDSDDSFDVIDVKALEELDPLQPEISIGSITVQAETGDITKETTDAIVTLSKTDLDVAYGGGVGKAILTAGGPSIQAECTSLGTQPAGAIVVTGAGKLQTRKIYHIIPEKVTMASLRDSMVKCLRLADKHGLTSISFPAIGTGNISMGVKESSDEMLAAIAKFAQEQPTSLQLIRIVIYQQHMLAVFRDTMEECISSVGGRGFFSRIAGGIAGLFGFSKSGSPSSFSAAYKKLIGGKDGTYLEIFAGTKRSITKAIEEIHKDLAEQCLTKVIENDAISKLSKDQKRKIKNLEAKHDATIKVEEPVGRISVKGDAEDVVDIATAIHEILNQQIEEEHTRGIEELLSKNVQWYYYEDEQEGFQPYDTSNNRKIESAFADTQNSVIVLIEGCRCEIVFKDMKETCLDDGEERQVVRKEIGKGVPLPLEWSVQPQDSSGKEKDVHLVQLDPITQATEYNKVADEIKKTAPITITKIERVQNPGLYRAYVVRKDQMDQKKGGNEKFLFHGTAHGSVSSINKFGFNRSYCGKNATVYGNGVYFARDASYSTQLKYSPVDASGNRYLYLARVLVGEFAVGRSGMITPPPKGSDATDAFDSVVDNTANPSIFVVFYDNQCYPDYLVTFK